MINITVLLCITDTENDCSTEGVTHILDENESNDPSDQKQDISRGYLSFSENSTPSRWKKFILIRKGTGRKQEEIWAIGTKHTKGLKWNLKLLENHDENESNDPSDQKQDISRGYLSFSENSTPSRWKKFILIRKGTGRKQEEIWAIGTKHTKGLKWNLKLLENHDENESNDPSDQKQDISRGYLSFSENSTPSRWKKFILIRKGTGRKQEEIWAIGTKHTKGLKWNLKLLENHDENESNDPSDQKQDISRGYLSFSENSTPSRWKKFILIRKGTGRKQEEIWAIGTKHTKGLKWNLKLLENHVNAKTNVEQA
ncbi:unnamed protein product [Diabrotica balteata]|uniref:Uncharacterized protein n=1 Tax=Diabrotica balteata TaxID=107213 RepID=A0A9N9XAC6_DIABA|nr:unnamed protein product [Diabrotica balteata]